MSIRIWHQSFTVLSDLGAYDDALRAHFRKVARPGTEIHLHGMLPGKYRNHYPGDDIKYSALQYLHGLQFMAAGINAQHQGFDAYAISTLPEPALKETRSLLDIPVVGYGESAMLTACMLGRTTHGINEVDGVPVLDSLGAWVKQAEAMVDLRRARSSRSPASCRGNRVKST